jgi:hypothetical protein
MRARWIPGLVVAVGVIVALRIPYGDCVNMLDHEGGPVLYTDCANHIPLRIAIAGIAAVIALGIAGIQDPQRRKWLWVAATTLSVALALAMLIPRGGPYFTAEELHFHGVGVIIPRWDNRNPLRVVVATAGAFIALVLALRRSGVAPRLAPSDSYQSLGQ